MSKNLTPDGKPMRTIRSFVKRKGRMTATQQDGIAKYWPEFGVDFQSGVLDLKALFGNDHPVVLEIGFGMGMSLLQMAEENPELNYLGVEVHTPGVGNLLGKAHLAGVTNLKVIEHDAIEVLNENIVGGALAGMQIFFPDPWHKTKHYKRRLIQEKFVELAASKIKADGFLHVATDWEHYAVQVLEVLSGCPQLKNKFAGYAPRPASRPLTKFEQRGHRLNHGVWDIYFERDPS